MALWYSMNIKTGRRKSDMDKESREFLEKKFLTLAQKDDLEKLRQESKTAFRQVKEENKVQIQEWREETKGILDQLRKEWTFGIDPLRSSLASSRQETKMDMDQLNAGVKDIAEKTNKVTDEISILSEKTRESFVEIREELGSMIKFSFADLERKLNALEARVKALEKKVLT